jgi:hypothetical protein
MTLPSWSSHASDGTHRVTPYARLDFVPNRGVAISAMAEPERFRPWFEPFRRAAGWT